MEINIIEGDLLQQPVEVIINPWNRNFLPWWLLLPQGVSGAIKKQGGLAPFRALAKAGMIPLGEAVLTEAGRLPFKCIIHVAGINIFWFATRYSIQQSVYSAMQMINQHGFTSAAFPVIGSGSGNYSREKALQLMLEAFSHIESKSKIQIVKYNN